MSDEFGKPLEWAAHEFDAKGRCTNQYGCSAIAGSDGGGYHNTDSAFEPCCCGTREATDREIIRALRGRIDELESRISQFGGRRG